MVPPTIGGQGDRKGRPYHTRVCTLNPDSWWNPNISITIVFNQDTCYTQTIRACLSVFCTKEEVESVNGSVSLPVDRMYPANQSVPQAYTQRKCRIVHARVQRAAGVVVQRNEQERTMEQETSFGKLLRRYRKSYGYYCTQAEIAERFGYSKETISSWEQGRRFPAHHEIARLAQLMGLEIQEVQDAIQVGHVRLHVNNAPEKTFLLHDDLSLANSPLFLESEQESDTMNKQRRELLRLLSTVGTAFALPLDIDWQRIGLSLAHPSYLDKGAIKDLAAINGQYWHLYINASLKPLILDGVLGQLKTIRQYLKHPHPTQVYTSLCALVSDLAQLAGEIYFDLHDHTTASICYTFATTAAKESRAYDLWACALTRYAFLPLYEKHYQEALPLLQGAQQLARNGDTSLCTRFWAAAVEAEAQSGLSNVDACQRALDEAQGVLEINEPSPAWLRFEGSRLPALRGACFVRLGQCDVAIPALQEALHHFVEPRRKRGLVLIDLAATSIQQKEIEQACVYANQVIDIGVHISSRFLGDGVRKLRSQLEPFTGLDSVHELDQRMRLLV